MGEVEARDSGESSEGFESADAPDDIATEFNPKEATSEVWFGDDAELAETFKACLREVGIHCVITADNGKERVLVLPAAEGRAKEIIREIVEQAPPELSKFLISPHPLVPSAHLNRRYRGVRMARRQWFERKFDFSFPVELYPEIMERLRGTPARIEERVKDLPPALLTRREGDRWSIQENIGHLLDLDELFAGRFEDFGRGSEKLRAADLLNQKTHQAQHNGQPLEGILREFRRGRLALVGRLESAPPDYFRRTALHPRLDSPMRVTDLLYFVAEHDDHHLARISEILRAV
jgi:uncharacterized damage-inducible protein DinB